MGEKWPRNKGIFGEYLESRSLRQISNKKAPFGALFCCLLDFAVEDTAEA